MLISLHCQPSHVPTGVAWIMSPPPFSRMMALATLPRCFNSTRVRVLPEPTIVAHSERKGLSLCWKSGVRRPAETFRLWDRLLAKQRRERELRGTVKNTPGVGLIFKKSSVNEVYSGGGAGVTSMKPLSHLHPMATPQKANSAYKKIKYAYSCGRHS